MADFDAILFDAGGVLVVPTPVVVRPVLASFGAEPDDATLVRAHFVAAHAMDHARLEGEQDGEPDGERVAWTRYHQAYVAAAAVPPDRQRAATAAFAERLDHWTWCHPVPGALDTLAALSARGVPIGVVSNAGGQVQAELARLGMCRIAATEGADPGGVLVACVVDSTVVGVSKPDPAIFAPALAAIGLPASPRVAYIGDTVTYDVHGAHAAGLSPVLHDPSGLHAADPHPSMPYRTITRLEDLLGMV